MMTTHKVSPPILSVFDFDGTLSYKDSFIPFLHFAFGRVNFILKMRQLVLPTLAHLRGNLTRDELKAQLISAYLTQVDEQWLMTKAETFCQRYFTQIMRPAACREIKQQQLSANAVTICSASPELVLQPFARRLNIDLIATELEVSHGHLTGKIIGQNCRAAEKVVRLTQRYGDLTHYYLKAWGDSLGDFELLTSAQEAHWQPFRPRWQKSRSPLRSR